MRYEISENNLLPVVCALSLQLSSRKGSDTSSSGTGRASLPTRTLGFWLLVELMNRLGYCGHAIEKAWVRHGVILRKRVVHEGLGNLDGNH